MSILGYRFERQIAGSLLLCMSLPVIAAAQQVPAAQAAGTSAVTQSQSLSQSNPESEAPQQSSQTPAAPVGTAAAPYENPLGVAASRPAGAVIAPAKQRRAHSLLIKLGLIIGGAAAIGTVVALSKSSSSRPN